jgi:predicted ATPase
MIEKLSIAGFKSLLDIQDLDLGQINVFIGANGSGKSSLLEAIGVLSAAMAGEVSDKTLRSRGVRLSVPELYKTSLKNLEAPKVIAFSVSGRLDSEQFDLEGKLIKTPIEYKVSLHSPNPKQGQGWRYKTESLRREAQTLVGRSPAGKSSIFGLDRLGSDNLDLKPEAGLIDFARRYADLGKAALHLIESVAGYVIYTPTTQVLRGIQTDSEQKYPVGLLGGRLPEAIDDILRLEENLFGTLDLDEVFELLPWIESFTITKPSRQLLSPNVATREKIIRFTDVWMRDTRNQLSGYDASEGALYVLFMLVLALHPKTPYFFAIDNFDQAMHPRLARAVTRMFCRLLLESDPPRQAVLTTHNPLVLDGLNLADERIRLFAVERGYETEGKTVIHRVQVSADVLQAQQDGLSLSNLWVMGRLGGVPRL